MLRLLVTILSCLLAISSLGGCMVRTDPIQSTKSERALRDGLEEGALLRDTGLIDQKSELLQTLKREQFPSPIHLYYEHSLSNFCVTQALPYSGIGDTHIPILTKELVELLLDFLLFQALNLSKVHYDVAELRKQWPTSAPRPNFESWHTNWGTLLQSAIAMAVESGFDRIAQRACRSGVPACSVLVLGVASLAVGIGKVQDYLERFGYLPQLRNSFEAVGRSRISTKDIDPQLNTYFATVLEQAQNPDSQRESFGSSYRFGISPDHIDAFGNTIAKVLNAKNFDVPQDGANVFSDAQLGTKLGQALAQEIVTLKRKFEEIRSPVLH